LGDYPVWQERVVGVILGGMAPEQAAKRRPAGMLFAFAAIAWAALAAWPAVRVRHCPSAGRCEWFPWLGVPAAIISVIAIAAAVRFVRWTLRGSDGFAAAVLLGIAVAFGAMWLVAFYLVLAATA